VGESSRRRTTADVQPDGARRARGDRRARPVSLAQDRLRTEFEQRIPERIRALNADFRTAMEEHPDSARPVVELYSLGEGPFAADAAKIKQTRIIKVAAR
jgi:hypothetical protein